MERLLGRPGGAAAARAREARGRRVDDDGAGRRGARSRRGGLGGAIGRRRRLRGRGRTVTGASVPVEVSETTELQRHHAHVLRPRRRGADARRRRPPCSDAGTRGRAPLYRGEGKITDPLVGACEPERRGAFRVGASARTAGSHARPSRALTASERPAQSNGTGGKSRAQTEEETPFRDGCRQPGKPKRARAAARPSAEARAGRAPFPPPRGWRPPPRCPRTMLRPSSSKRRSA